ncbi:MAG: diguanylate cyclase [Myxococcales bacterium]|nr:diguanylate cyclase [Myxococcales bacterium]
MRSIGTRLLLAVALPASVVALLGTAAAWRQTDAAVREKTRADAVGLAEFVATSFGTVDDTRPGTPPRVAHRAVTNAVRSDWSAMKLVTELRIVDRQGVVRWSRRIEEEDKVLPDAQRLLAVTAGRASFETPPGLSPLGGGGGDVIYPLGGVACGGCHTGEATMRAGVLQLVVGESALRRQVAEVFFQATGFVVAFVVALALLVFVAVRVFVSRRVARLSAVMKRVEDGDLVVRAPDLGQDELGQLARAYNKMLARLTALKASEIDTQRDLDHARTELSLKAELETRVGELQILYDLARTITSTLELNEVLARIAQVVPKQLKVPKFSIMLLNGEGLLEVLKAFPANVGSEGLTFSVGEGICGHAAATRKDVYVPDLEIDGSFRIRGGAGARGRGCLLAVPMVHGDELLGVLNFERPEKADFSAEEIEFFTAVAGQAAMAVQNARLHEQTVALSVTDPLTGIPNRRYLFQQLDAEIVRANRFGTQLSVLMIDIDHFKHLNDTAGHSAGDEVLKQVSSILRNTVRKVDTVARYGGEEFLVLLPQIARPEAQEVAEKLRRSVEESVVQHARAQPGGKVTISVGVANLPGDAAERVKLVDCADSALYASKRGGRNRVTAYQPGMELDPTRQRGPHAQRRRTGEVPLTRA